MLTVNSLRKRGFTVYVRHNRCYAEPNQFGKAVLVSKGGATEVWLTRPVPAHLEDGWDLNAVYGVAECSPKDDYNKKRGVRIALGRALKIMGLPTK